MSKNNKAQSYIVEILSKQKLPMSVSHCLKIASSEGVQFHKTTFYRAFHKLLNSSTLTLAGFENGEHVYSLASNHTHIISCQVCKTETELATSILQKIESTFESVERELKSSYQFSSIKHIVQFSGTCSICNHI